MEFEIESTDKNKYVTIALEFSNKSSRNYS